MPRARAPCAGKTARGRQRRRKIRDGWRIGGSCAAGRDGGDLVKHGASLRNGLCRQDTKSSRSAPTTRPPGAPARLPEYTKTGIARTPRADYHHLPARQALGRFHKARRARRKPAGIVILSADARHCPDEESMQRKGWKTEKNLKAALMKIVNPVDLLSTRHPAMAASANSGSPC